MSQFFESGVHTIPIPSGAVAIKLELTGDGAQIEFVIAQSARGGAGGTLPTTGTAEVIIPAGGGGFLHNTGGGSAHYGLIVPVASSDKTVE